MHDILVEKRGEKRPLWGPGINESIILMWILNKLDEMWTGLNWIEPSAVPCEHCNKS